jgi:Flp pilus assembly protein TadD
MADPAFLHRVQAGIRLIERGELEQAERLFRELTTAHPRDAGLWNLLGAALHKADRPVEALAACRRALELDRRNPDYLYSVGSVQLVLQNFDEALKRFRATLAARPNDPDVLLDLGRALSGMGDLPQAEATFRRVLQRNPRASQAYVALGEMYRAAGLYEEAERSYREGLESLPSSGDLHFYFSLLLLGLARFREGWAEYQWRVGRWEKLARAGIPFFTYRETPWGERLDGLLLELRAEQGLGDILFFLRFAGELRRRGAWTLLYVPARLLDMVRRAGCADEVRDEAAAPSLHRDAVLIGDLPFLLGMGDGDMPPPLRLEAQPARVGAMRGRLAACGPAPYTALAWRAGLNPGGNPYVLKKEMPLEDFAHVVRAIPGTLVAVQRNPMQGEIARLAELAGRQLHDFSGTNADLEEALALMACMDDCVGVSNTNLHLLAGVGGHARVLVPAPYEWRWLAQGNASPWFEGFSVFRQKHGNWNEALKDFDKSLINN